MEEIRNHLQNLNQPNYYMPMIIASVIGGVILLVLIIVGGLYLKRTTTYKAIISGGDRRNQKASFTNRAFKVGILLMSKITIWAKNGKIADFSLKS